MQIIGRTRKMPRSISLYLPLDVENSTDFDLSFMQFIHDGLAKIGRREYCAKMYLAVVSYLRDCCCNCRKMRRHDVF